jgi:hypothetical protein
MAFLMFLKRSGLNIRLIKNHDQRYITLKANENGLNRVFCPGLYLPVNTRIKYSQMEFENGFMQIRGVHLQFIPKRIPERRKF